MMLRGLAGRVVLAVVCVLGLGVPGVIAASDEESGRYLQRNYHTFFNLDSAATPERGTWRSWMGFNQDIFTIETDAEGSWRSDCFAIGVHGLVGFLLDTPAGVGANAYGLGLHGRYQLGNFGVQGLGNSIGVGLSYVRAELYVNGFINGQLVSGTVASDDAVGAKVTWATTYQRGSDTATVNVGPVFADGAESDWSYGAGYARQFGAWQLGGEFIGSTSTGAKALGPLVQLGREDSSFHGWVNAMFGLNRQTQPFTMSVGAQF